MKTLFLKLCNEESMECMVLEILQFIIIIHNESVIEYSPYSMHNYLAFDSIKFVSI